jgi:hypothetical protein
MNNRSFIDLYTIVLTKQEKKKKKLYIHKHAHMSINQ